MMHVHRSSLYKIFDFRSIICFKKIIVEYILNNNKIYNRNISICTLIKGEGENRKPLSTFVISMYSFFMSSILGFMKYPFDAFFSLTLAGPLSSRDWLQERKIGLRFH